MKKRQTPKGMQPHNFQLQSVSIVAWPTHPNGRPFSEQEAARYGIHRIEIVKPSEEQGQEQKP